MHFERAPSHRLSPHLSMIAGYVNITYLFIYSLQEIRIEISYHLLWIKLYVPLILKPCLYLFVLEEDKGVQYILQYSIILILLPNVSICMLHFI